MSAPTASVSRAWGVIQALSGQTYSGLRLGQVADLVKQSPSTTLRDLRALESLGLTERIPGSDENWRLSPRIVRIAIAHQTELAQLQQRLDDFTHRYSRSP